MTQIAASPRPAPGLVESREIAQGRAIPAYLTRLRLGVALLMLTVAALTVAQLFLGRAAANRAAADAEQVARIQTIKVDLLRADALATNAFLTGGLEATAQRTAYDQAIGAASATIAAASSAQSLDRDALAELNALLVRYAAGMEVARANNRLGLPVGAAYLRAASADLRGRGMVLTDALLTANTVRARSSLADQHPVWVALPGLLALGGLYAANRWIATRFRRRINVGIAVAGGLTLLLTLGAVAVSSAQALENTRLQDGSYGALLRVAQARSSANAAKSSESLRLIARGSGKSFEEAWATQSKDVSGLIPDTLRDPWTAYTKAHAALVAKDDAGDWDGAVALATSTAAGAATPAFQEFDTQLAAELDGDRASVDSALNSGNWVPVLVAVLAGLAGLGATWASWRGVSRRLEEYV